MKKHQIAVLSTAHIHTRQLLEQVQNTLDCAVCAIWDDNVERGEKYADEFQAKFHANLDDLLARKSISAFVIAAENSLHLSLLEKTIPLGKSIYCEKPLATSQRELDRIVPLVKKHRTRICCSYYLPFQGPLQNVKKLLKQQAFGKITRVRYILEQPAAYALWFDNPELAWFHEPDLAVGGAFLDLGTHAIHVLRTLFGPAKKIWAQIRNESGVYPKLDDYGFAMMEMKDGILGSVEAAWTQIGGINGLEISGSLKSLWHNGSTYMIGKQGGEPTRLGEGIPQPDRVERLFAMLRDEIPDGELHADLEAVYDSVRMVEAAYESSKQNKWINLA
jgi:predicted dehydrogenase